MTTNFDTRFDPAGGHQPKTAVARTAGLVSLLVLAVGLGGLALGIDWAWVAFPIGYGGVLPLEVTVSTTSRSTRRSPS